MGLQLSGYKKKVTVISYSLDKEKIMQITDTAVGKTTGDGETFSL